jgi:hydroxymethylpyrimidine/phosphomethylpyrimidine kinase
MVASGPVVPRCLSIAGSDSGGGAGVQADLKAFARCGCHGMTAIVALTAQSTSGVSGVHAVPPAFVEAQLEALVTDIGLDAAKTGMLFSRPIVEVVATFLAAHAAPLVVDPVMVASSGASLLQDDAADALVTRLFPLATVVTPNLREACALADRPYRDDAEREGLAEAIHGLGAPAVIVTGGHGVPSIDWLFDGRRHVPISVERVSSEATHGAGCTHSAALAAFLARGLDLEDAARGAAMIASRAVRNGLADLGSGPGPVDVLGIETLGREALAAR